MIQTDGVVTSTINTYSGSSSTSSISHEQFLQLMVAQLKNQDPLTPMESNEFTTQLAQISSLEQLVSIDSNVEEGIGIDLVLTQAINNTLAATLIGKDVTAYGNDIALQEDRSVDIDFKLSSFAEKVEVQVYDQAGNLVRTIETNGLAAGKHSVIWDGEGNNGEDFPEGEYSFTVTATDGNGTEISSYALMVGMISSVRFENGAAVLMVNGREIAFSNVLEIGVNS